MAYDLPFLDHSSQRRLGRQVSSLVARCRPHHRPAGPLHCQCPPRRAALWPRPRRRSLASGRRRRQGRRQAGRPRRPCRRPRSDAGRHCRRRARLPDHAGDGFGSLVPAPPLTQRPLNSIAGILGVSGSVSPGLLVVPAFWSHRWRHRSNCFWQRPFSPARWPAAPPHPLAVSRRATAWRAPCISSPTAPATTACLRSERW